MLFLHSVRLSSKSFLGVSTVPRRCAISSPVHCVEEGVGTEDLCSEHLPPLPLPSPTPCRKRCCMLTHVLMLVLLLCKTYHLVGADCPIVHVQSLCAPSLYYATKVKNVEPPLFLTHTHTHTSSFANIS